MRLSELQREVANHPLYRGFVVGNFERCCGRMFPIAKKALGDDWELLLEDFMPHARSPYYWRMPKDLVDFVEEPRLKDLLRFEWLETEVQRMPEQEIPNGSPFVLNPDSEIAHFHYPVFRVPFDQLADHRGDYFLFIFRHPEKLNVCFVELDPLYVVAVEKFAREFAPLEDRSFFKELLDQGAILDRRDHEHTECHR